MELWTNLLFGNWIGLLSVITIGGAFLVIVVLLVMLIRKSTGS
jgi:hypothetical protein